MERKFCSNYIFWDQSHITIVWITKETDDINYQVKRGHDGEDDEPEPEHDVDLLVDDVQGKDAHGVVSLNCAGGTIFVEGALGDSVKKNIFTNFK